jgi:hypothetical protein
MLRGIGNRRAIDSGILLLRLLRLRVRLSEGRRGAGGSERNGRNRKRESRDAVEGTHYPESPFSKDAWKSENLVRKNVVKVQTSFAAVRRMEASCRINATFASP